MANAYVESPDCPARCGRAHARSGRAQCPARAPISVPERGRARARSLIGSARAFHARGPIHQTARKALVDAETCRFAGESRVDGETEAAAGFRPRLSPSVVRDFTFASPRDRNHRSIVHCSVVCPEAAHLRQSTITATAVKQPLESFRHQRDVELPSRFLASPTSASSSDNLSLIATLTENRWFSPRSAVRGSPREKAETRQSSARSYVFERARRSLPRTIVLLISLRSPEPRAASRFHVPDACRCTKSFARDLLL